MNAKLKMLVLSCQVLVLQCIINKFKLVANLEIVYYFSTNQEKENVKNNYVN